MREILTKLEEVHDLIAAEHARQSATFNGCSIEFRVSAQGRHVENVIQDLTVLDGMVTLIRDRITTYLQF